jgi:hypothetical protein
MTRQQAAEWLTWARANWHAEGCQCGRCPEARRVLGAPPPATCDCYDLREREDWDSSMPGCSCEGACPCHDEELR